MKKKHEKLKHFGLNYFKPNARWTLPDYPVFRTKSQLGQTKNWSSE